MQRRILSLTLVWRAGSFTRILPIVIGMLQLILPSTAFSYTPESPEVQRMVQRGLRFLDKETYEDPPMMALSAMAIFKGGEPASHPKIQAALKACKEACRTPDSARALLRSVYDVSVVGLFLCEVDPQGYKTEIENVIKSLEKRQKPFGGWGYEAPDSNSIYGDTSMTQYAVLCAWLARAVGAAEIGEASVRKVAYWLVRTQDPSGAWGYQGRDPGEGQFYKRLPQSEVRHSLCVAGLGSLYICSGIMGITPEAVVETTTDLPPALKLIEDRSAESGPGVIEDKNIQRALRDGNAWYKNNYRINPPEYALYYLYTLERYHSFREIAEGRRPKEPRWYNDGVRFLQSTQKKNGSWNLEGGTFDTAQTAFAIFFLVRSAQKTIQKAQDEFDGLLVAGRGLPGNTQDVRMKQGKIVTTPFQGTAKSLLEILNDEDHPDFDSVAALESVPLSRNPRERKLQLERMRRLVNARSFKTRLVAVKSLAKARNLDNVPALIYALSDPDKRVAMAARDGLRFQSRRFEGFGLDDAFGKEALEGAVKAWKEWYLKIRPEARFLDE